MPNRPIYITPTKSTSSANKPDGGAHENFRKTIATRVMTKRSATKKPAAETDDDSDNTDHHDHHTTAPSQQRRARKGKGKARTEEDGDYNGDVSHRFDFHTNGLQLEVKLEDTRDPLNTFEVAYKLGYCENKTDAGSETRGQLACYVQDLCAHQHRTHLFQLTLIGTYARFFRWDRAGAIASDRFNYVKSPAILSKFLWHYDKMSKVACG